MKLYTIFLGDSIWQNVIDDMNSSKAWSYGGMLWTNKELAIACMESLKKYDFETENEKFSIVSLIVDK